MYTLNIENTYIPYVQEYALQIQCFLLLPGLAHQTFDLRMSLSASLEPHWITLSDWGNYSNFSLTTVSLLCCAVSTSADSCDLFIFTMKLQHRQELLPTQPNLQSQQRRNQSLFYDFHFPPFLFFLDKSHFSLRIVAVPTGCSKALSGLSPFYIPELNSKGW